MSWLLEPFGYHYMLNAMWVSALVGGVCAFLSGGLAAGSMLFLQQRSRLKEDAIIGLIFSSFFGIGLFMVSLIRRR